MLASCIHGLVVITEQTFVLYSLWILKVVLYARNISFNFMLPGKRISSNRKSLLCSVTLMVLSCNTYFYISWLWFGIFSGSMRNSQSVCSSVKWLKFRFSYLLLVTFSNRLNIFRMPFLTVCSCFSSFYPHQQKA